jgi:hypothetical protein
MTAYEIIESLKRLIEQEKITPTTDILLVSPEDGQVFSIMLMNSTVYNSLKEKKVKGGVLTPITNKDYTTSMSFNNENIDKNFDQIVSE